MKRIYGQKELSDLKNAQTEYTNRIEERMKRIEGQRELMDKEN